jgi:hypothetical protein
LTKTAVRLGHLVKRRPPATGSPGRRFAWLAVLLLALPLVADADVATWNRLRDGCIASGGRPSANNYNGWVAGNGCICPGSTKGSGQATCPSGSGGSSSSSSAGAPAATLVTGVMTSNSGMVGAGLGGLLGTAIADSLRSSASVAPPDPQAQQRQIDAQNAAMARRQARTDRLDREAFLRMSLLDAPFNPEKPITTEARSPAACGTSEEEYACHVVVCGGAFNGPSVCCPAGFPKLNECDCKCYAASASFECRRYAACNRSSGSKLLPDAPPPPGQEPRK